MERIYGDMLKNDRKKIKKDIDFIRKNKYNKRNGI